MSRFDHIAETLRVSAAEMPGPLKVISWAAALLAALMLGQLAVHVATQPFFGPGIALWLYETGVLAILAFGIFTRRSWSRALILVFPLLQFLPAAFVWSASEWLGGIAAALVWALVFGLYLWRSAAVQSFFRGRFERAA